jgi:hypothetical protein
MKRTILWDVTLCSPAEVHGRFEGTYCLHLQGQRLSQTKLARSRRQAEQLFYRAARRYISEDSSALDMFIDLFHLSIFCDGLLDYVKVSLKMDDILCNNGIVIMEPVLLYCIPKALSCV